ncbi:MAG: hypothetical protein PGN07_07520 [Aeromicrobium erythreum]
MVDDAPFEVRRRVWLHLLAAVVPIALAAGFAWFAYDRDDLVLWVPAGLLVLLGLTALSGLRDVRTPLFVADDHGVRMRDGRAWVGLLWSEMADVRVERRSGRFDPRVKVISPDGLRIYTAQVGFTTTVTAQEAEEQLARRRGPAAY